MARASKSVVHWPGQVNFGLGQLNHTVAGPSGKLNFAAEKGIRSHCFSCKILP